MKRTTMNAMVAAAALALPVGAGGLAYGEFEVGNHNLQPKAVAAHHAGQIATSAEADPDYTKKLPALAFGGIFMALTLGIEGLALAQWADL